MPQTILYFDDLPELPDRVDEILAQAGYTLTHVADPAEFRRLVSEGPPALVLVEVLHSGCEAFDLIEELTCTPAAGPLPIVVVTRGERTPQIYGRAVELGVADFLCKPVVGAQILEAVLEFAVGDGSEVRPEATQAPAIEAFQGTLEEEPLANLLGKLHRAGASGVLRLESGSCASGIQLRNGSPVEIEKHREAEPVADYLRRTKRIDADQYEMLVDQLMARVAGPREILMGMEALSEDELAAAGREQGLGILLEMFTWTSGTFGFQPDARLDGTDTLELDESPTKVLKSGISRTPDAAIRNALERRANLYASFAQHAPNRIDGHQLTTEQRRQIEALMGDRTVADILESETLDARTLFALCAMGGVELGEAAVLILDDELELREPDEVRTLPQARAPERQPPEPSNDPVETQTEAAPDLSSSFAGMLDDLAERLDSEDDFELFGIDETSPDADVRAAFDQLLAQLQLGDDSSQPEEIQTRAKDTVRRFDQAYQRVRSADMRRAFSGLRKKKKKQPVVEEEPNRESGSRAVEAESWFRTGEGFLKHEDYRQAAESFGMAVHLDPEQGDYAAYLGYSLYLSNPENSIIQREALEHVAKGVKISPNREKPLLFLSRIFRETGELEMAAKVLRRALRANPDSPALVQEMCLIDPGSSQSKRKKLLDRFRRS